ncbi:unnamed protein product [marine sediment metagenome]|uniref:Uncharacterized protein n=1 Tax=marine sediment metagenome TaxID=412755 RepID=X1S5A8_9ZZZZ
MEHYELRVLADYLHTGAQAVNTWERPTPRTVLGELERDERAEAVFAEIVSPVTGVGVEEELKKIIPVLDGQKYGEYVSLSGIRSSVMAPPKGRIWGAKLYSFGTPMSNNPLLSTTLKYSESITVETLVGATTAITQNYRIRLWGYIYKVGELSRVFGTMLFPASLIDRARGRTLPISKAAIPVNGDTWRTLPGGKDQSIPKINPLIRYAYNLLATDAKSGDYQFRYETGNVAETDENLYFDFGSLDAVLVEGLGIRPDAAGNLAKTALKIGGDYHPKGLIPTTLTNNPLHFGWADPFFPDTIPLYYAIPKLERPYLIWNEIGMLIVRDDGTEIGINALIAALTGIRIEMKGG